MGLTTVRRLAHLDTRVDSVGSRGGRGRSTAVGDSSRSGRRRLGLDRSLRDDDGTCVLDG